MGRGHMGRGAHEKGCTWVWEHNGVWGTWVGGAWAYDLHSTVEKTT